MDIDSWLSGRKIAEGGDSEVRESKGLLMKKWNLSLEQVKLYQVLMNMCSKYSFKCKNFNISIHTIDDVFQRGPFVFSTSQFVTGRTVNTIDPIDKLLLGCYFQKQLNFNLQAITNAQGINVINWNAMLLNDGCSVVITDIASSVRAISL